VALADILAAVNAGLPPGTQVLFGEKYVGTNDVKPNSVVWAPGNESFGPARQGRGPKSIRTRTVSVTAFLWAVGEDNTAEGHMRACEALLGSVIVAVERAAAGSYDVTGGTWDVTGPGTKGRSYALALSFDVPVLAPERRVTLAAVEQDTGLAFRTGDVSGVPSP
jgi:hypothetical protein